MLRISVEGVVYWIYLKDIGRKPMPQPVQKVVTLMEAFECILSNWVNCCCIRWWGNFQSVIAPITGKPTAMFSI